MKRILSAAAALMLVLCIGGCSKTGGSEASESSSASAQSSEGSSVQLSVTPAEKSKPDESYIMTDELFTDNFKGKEFLAYKTHDCFYFADDDCNRVKSSDIDSLPVEHGEFLLINADGVIYNGGVAGYVDYPSIEKINSAKKLSMQEVFDKYDVPELSGITLSYKNNIVRYTSGDKTYLILKNGAPNATTFDIYLDGALVGSSDELVGMSDIPAYIDGLKT